MVWVDHWQFLPGKHRGSCEKSWGVVGASTFVSAGAGVVRVVPVVPASVGADPQAASPRANVAAQMAAAAFLGTERELVVMSISFMGSDDMTLGTDGPPVDR
jgi:hypothetical protein